MGHFLTLGGGDIVINLLFFVICIIVGMFKLFKYVLYANSPLGGGDIVVNLLLYLYV